MELELQKNIKLQRSLTVTAEADEIAQLFNKVSTKIQKDLKLDGFRAGKVPLNIIAKRYSKEIKQEVKKLLYNQTMQEAQKKFDLEFAYELNESCIDENQLSPDNKIIFSADFEVVPSFEFPKVDSFNIEIPENKISEEQTADYIKVMELNMSSYTPSQESIKKYDKVEAIMIGLKGDKVVFNDKKAPMTMQPGTKMHLTEIENELLGMKVGQKKTIKISDDKLQNTGPADNNAFTNFEITIQSVQSPQPWEWNEQKVKQVAPECNNFEQLKKVITDYLLKVNQNKIQEQARKQLKEKLATSLDFDVPQKLLEYEQLNRKNNDKYFQLVTEQLNKAKQEGQKNITLNNPEQGEDKTLTIAECEQEISRYEKKLMEDTAQSIRLNYVIAKITKQQKLQPRKQLVDYMFQEVAHEFKLHPQDLMKAPYGRNIYNNLEMEDVSNQALNWYLTTA